MKKLRKKLSRVIGLVLAMAMMLSVGTGVMAEDNGQPDEFSLRVGHMLGAVAQDAQTMGMAGVNFDNLYLGECAHTENGISFYPIFEGENPTPVATISTWLDESGKRQLQFGAGVSMALSEKNIWLGMGGKKLYVTSTYAMTSKSLNVPVVGQGTSADNMLCWAACVSAVAIQQGRGSMSPLSIAQAAGLSETSGADLRQVSAALGRVFYMQSRVFDNSRLYIDTIKTNIDNNKPIIVETKIAAGMPHAITVLGYVSSGTAASSYVTFMDPDGFGGTRTVEIRSNLEYCVDNSYNSPPFSTRATTGYITL